MDPNPRPTPSPNDELVDFSRPVPPPPPREVPVRPRELDAIGPDPRVEPHPAPTTAKPAAERPASARPAERAADGPVPCPKCRYDLRGRPGGSRCPECGTLIPSRQRVALRPGERRSARDALFGAWYGLSSASLVSAFMISPIPYIIPLGVVLSVCAGFAPAFRLFALRSLDELPGPLRGPLAPLIGRFRTLERIEVALAGLITAGALLSTVGLLGGKAIPFYHLGLFVWWLVAALALVTQVKLGDAASQLLVDPELLPLDVPQRTLLWLRCTLAAGLLGGLLAVYGAAADRMSAPMPLANAALNAAGPILLLVCAAHVVCAIYARAHAILVANCVFESEFFRADPNRRVPGAPPSPGADPEDASGDGPDAIPASKRHSYTPKHDDGPIRLPGE